TDREVRRVLPERHLLVERGRRGLGYGLAADDLAAANALDDLPQVLGRRTAAAADESDAVVTGESLVRVGELLRRERVDGTAGWAELGQAGVGHAGQADPGVRGEVAQVLA